jgi:carotenoid cleavage dioxygenase-like enzyme
LLKTQSSQFDRHGFAVLVVIVVAGIAVVRANAAVEDAGSLLPTFLHTSNHRSLCLWFEAATVSV